ncbi:hypothetical protein RB653_001393 [Dictyostelium firmibasis]|uniref:RNI-like protein n=1 Tax=Dictyostelium firmibasis TaxID=79012 RepID=A0AAN7YWL6_9MYCE
MVWGQVNNNGTSLFNNTIKQLKENATESLFLIPTFIPINENNAVEFSQGLSMNTSLTELYMHGHELGEQGLIEIGKSIRNHPNLKTISIGNSEIGLNLIGLQSLLTNVLKSKNLRNIDFSKQSINSKSLSVINDIFKEGEGNNNNLTYLNFGENQLDSESLLYLEGIIKSNENIEFLNIGGNQITKFTDSFIQSIIDNGKQLKKLVLSANPLKDNSDDDNNDSIGKHISKLLLNSSGLKEIELNDCELNERSCKIIGESLLNWKGTSFTATGNSLMGSSLTSSWLSLSSSSSSSYSNNIKHLSLRGCFIGDQGVKSIMNAISMGVLPNLNLLDVAYNKLTLESLVALNSLVIIDSTTSKPLHYIEYLDASFNKFGCETKEIIIGWIKSNKITQLKCLSLNNVGMKFLDTFEISKVLVDNSDTTSLKLLELMGNDQIDEIEMAKYQEKQKDEKERLKEESSKIQKGEEEEENVNEEEGEEDVYEVLSENIDVLKREKKLVFKWK